MDNHFQKRILNELFHFHLSLKPLNLWIVNLVVVPEENNEYGEDALDDDGKEEDECEGVGEGEAPGTRSGQAQQAQQQQADTFTRTDVI